MTQEPPLSTDDWRSNLMAITPTLSPMLRQILSNAIESSCQSVENYKPQSMSTLLFQMRGIFQILRKWHVAEDRRVILVSLDKLLRRIQEKVQDSELKYELLRLLDQESTRFILQGIDTLQGKLPVNPDLSAEDAFAIGGNIRGMTQQLKPQWEPLLQQLKVTQKAGEALKVATTSPTLRDGHLWFLMYPPTPGEVGHTAQLGISPTPEMGALLVSVLTFWMANPEVKALFETLFHCHLDLGVEEEQKTLTLRSDLHGRCELALAQDSAGSITAHAVRILPLAPPTPSQRKLPTELQCDGIHVFLSLLGLSHITHVAPPNTPEE